MIQFTCYNKNHYTAYFFRSLIMIILIAHGINKFREYFMLHNDQEYISKTSSLYRDYQINDSVSDKQAEVSPLTSKIKGAANSNESLASMTVHFSPEEGQVRSSHRPKGWLKYLIIGVSVLAGTAALVAGALTFLSRREGNGNQVGCIADAEFLPQILIKMPCLPSSERLSMPGTDVQISSTTVVPFNNTEVKNNSSEPYSYYKNIYGTKVLSNITETKNSSSNSDLDYRNLNTTDTSVNSILTKNNVTGPYVGMFAMTTFNNTDATSIPDDQISSTTEVTLNRTNPALEYDGNIYIINESGEEISIGTLLPKRLEESPDEISRADFLKTIPRDIYYPLGKKCIII